MTSSLFSKIRSGDFLISGRSVRTDVENARVDAQVYCVRDVDEPDLGIRDRHFAEAKNYVTDGIGFLYSEASDEIQETIALEEHVVERAREVL